MTANERQAVLEEQLKNLKLEVDEIKTTVKEIHTVLIHARGARWAVITVLSVVTTIGALVGSFFPHWFQNTN